MKMVKDIIENEWFGKLKYLPKYIELDRTLIEQMKKR